MSTLSKVTSKVKYIIYLLSLWQGAPMSSSQFPRSMATPFHAITVHASIIKKKPL